MKQKPKAFAFDVIGTLFAIDSLEEKLKAAGLPDGSLKIWFPRVLRDAFALEVAGQYKTFAEVASGALEVLLRENKIEPDKGWIDDVINAFAKLPSHPDVQPAFRMLREAGLPIFALTNGSVETTKKLFANSGLEDQVEQFISIDAVKHWKPAAAVYLHAAKIARVKPEELALVAAHDWDINGAGRAGLTTGYVAREQPICSPAMKQADVAGQSLTEVVLGLLALSA